MVHKKSYFKVNFELHDQTDQELRVCAGARVFFCVPLMIETKSELEDDRVVVSTRPQSSLAA